MMRACVWAESAKGAVEARRAKQAFNWGVLAWRAVDTSFAMRSLSLAGGACGAFGGSEEALASKGAIAAVARAIALSSIRMKAIALCVLLTLIADVDASILTP